MCASTPVKPLHVSNVAIKHEHILRRAHGASGKWGRIRPRFCHDLQVFYRRSHRDISCAGSGMLLTSTNVGARLPHLGGMGRHGSSRPSNE